ncbi:hypothetical protein Tco_1102711 [Tanacetum coccineum]
MKNVDKDRGVLATPFTKEKGVIRELQQRDVNPAIRKTRAFENAFITSVENGDLKSFGNEEEKRRRRRVSLPEPAFYKKFIGRRAIDENRDRG